MPIIAKMKTQTPIRAIAVNSTMLLGVRYSLALQLHRREAKETLVLFIRTQSTASKEITSIYKNEKVM